MAENELCFISTVHARGFRLFKELDVKFNQRFNFIIGPNGTGKTSLLRCIAMCLSTNDLSDSRYGNKVEVWLDFESGGRTFRTGYGNSTNDDTPSWIINTAYMNAQARAWYDPPSDGVEEAFSVPQIETKVPDFSPLVLGAYRKIDYKKMQGMQREEPARVQSQRNRSIAAASLRGAFVPDVKQWLINRYFIIEKPWAETERINWEWLMANIQHISPKGISFDFKEILQDLEPKFSLEGEVCYLEELSAGFQSILSMIFAIFSWVEAINEGECRLVRNAVGTVIVDELDAHLHPEWQFSIRETLDKLFPRLQFIVTTHSPHLIATAQPGEILILPKHNGSVNIEPLGHSFAGWNTDQILEEIMGVQSIRTKLYSQLLAEAVQCYTDKDVKGLDIVIKKLEGVVHPRDPVIEVFKIKLATLLLQGGAS